MMAIDPTRTPETPTRLPSPLTKHEDPETVQRRLTTAWKALDQHRETPKLGDVIYRDIPGCSAGCLDCDLECSILSAFVFQEWEAYQQALAENGHTLTHGGRVYATLAGRA